MRTHATEFGLGPGVLIAFPFVGTIRNQQEFRQNPGSEGNALKKPAPVESAVIPPEPVILDHCEKG